MLLIFVGGLMLAFSVFELIGADVLDKVDEVVDKITNQKAAGPGAIPVPAASAAEEAAIV
jgi:hypothetical protein